MSDDNAVIDTSRQAHSAAGLSLLEQVNASAAQRCLNPKSPKLIGRDFDARQAVGVKAFCDMWSCPPCAARNAKRWIARTINGINKLGGKWWFVTITAHEKWRGAERSLENIRRNWSKLYERMKRKHGGKFHYVKVWEPHEDGSWHLHLIAQCKLPYSKKNKGGSRWLKNAAAACGLGKITEYQPCRHAGFAAHYVAKYLMKSPTLENAPDYPKNLHRIRTSNNFPELPDLTEDDDRVWSYVGSSERDLTLSLLREWQRGYDIFRQNGSKISDGQVFAWLVSSGIHHWSAKFLYDYASQARAKILSIHRMNENAKEDKVDFASNLE